MLWPALLLSSLLAPLLRWGPPNLPLFLFPTAMLPNILVSLLAVWAASRAAHRPAAQKRPPQARAAERQAEPAADAMAGERRR